MSNIVREVPPPQTDIGLKAYFTKQVDRIQLAINAIGVGVISINELPKKPREGRIYYLENDGLYVNLQNEWHTINTTPV